MSKFLLTSVVVLASMALPAAAQDLLPPSFSGWNAPAAAIEVRPDALEGFVGADAAVLREDGTLAAERRVYSRGTETLTVTLYRMRDSTAAYGAYTYLLTEQMSPASLAERSCWSRARALILEGNLVLDITGSDVRPLAAGLKKLVARLAPQADKTPYPTLGRYLPVRGLVSNSERYFLGPLALNHLLPLGNGDWLGFADGAEAELARYRIHGQEATLLLASYPTPQVAARKLEELSHWLPLNPAEEQADDRPVLFARRSGSLMALVAHTRSRAVADSLLQQIHYESEVTWNEPRHRLTDPSISQIVVGTIVGTGIILLFALVAGIGFGGMRLLVKHFFPGKVFDRASQVEILQLGLSSKPIEAKDFY